MIASEDDFSVEHPEGAGMPAASVDAHEASALAIGPHASGQALPRPASASTDRYSPFSQPTLADPFAPTRSQQAIVHSVLTDQCKMMLRMATFEHRMHELQQRVGALERRLVHQRDMQDELDSTAYNTHKRIASVQETVRAQSFMVEELQNLCLRVDHALQVGHAPGLELNTSQL